MSLPAHWSAETVDSDGVSLQTYRTGSGPPILFLHGYYDGDILPAVNGGASHSSGNPLGRFQSE